MNKRILITVLVLCIAVLFAIGVNATIVGEWAPIKGGNTGSSSEDTGIGGSGNNNYPDNSGMNNGGFVYNPNNNVSIGSTGIVGMYAYIPDYNAQIVSVSENSTRTVSIAVSVDNQNYTIGHYYRSYAPTITASVSVNGKTIYYTGNSNGADAIYCYNGDDLLFVKLPKAIPISRIGEYVYLLNLNKISDKTFEQLFMNSAQTADTYDLIVENPAESISSEAID